MKKTISILAFLFACFGAFSQIKQPTHTGVPESWNIGSKYLRGQYDTTTHTMKDTLSFVLQYDSISVWTNLQKLYFKTVPQFWYGFTGKGQVKMETDSGYSLINGNPYGDHLFVDGYRFRKQVDGGYLNIGVVKDFQDEYYCNIGFNNDTLTTNGFKASGLSIDQHEIGMRIRNFSDPANKIFRSLDITDFEGLDYQEYDNVGDSIIHPFGYYLLRGGYGTKKIFHIYANVYEYKQLGFSKFENIITDTGYIFQNKYGAIMSADSSRNHVKFYTDVVQDATKAFYLGDENSNGSWRIIRSGNNLLMQRRESGSWVTKNTITP